MLFITFLAATLHVPDAIVSTVFTIIMHADAAIMVGAAVAALASGGASAILALGLGGLKAKLRSLAAESMAKAIAW